MIEDGPRRRGRRATPAERRERHAAVDDPAVVFDAALRFLETRSRSTVEVRRRLRTAGYEAGLVEGAVTRLVELGILDDAAFAATWVASRDRAHPRGETALRRELSQKGIERSLVERVLEERRGSAPAAQASPDEDAAERLLARHAGALARIADPRRRRERAYALLARHGFDTEIAGRLARRAVSGEDVRPASFDDDGEAGGAEKADGSDAQDVPG